VITKALGIQDNDRALGRWDLRLNTRTDYHVSDRSIQTGFATQQRARPQMR
jgi:hypothetical protein